jgi:CHASE1-domain containing sensor protein
MCLFCFHPDTVTWTKAVHVNNSEHSRIDPMNRGSRRQEALTSSVANSLSLLSAVTSLMEKFPMNQAVHIPPKRWTHFSLSASAESAKPMGREFPEPFRALNP